MEKEKSKERKERQDDGWEEALEAGGKCVFVNIFLLLFGRFCRRGKVEKKDEKYCKIP